MVPLEGSGSSLRYPPVSMTLTHSIIHCVTLSSSLSLCSFLLSLGTHLLFGLVSLSHTSDSESVRPPVRPSVRLFPSVRASHRFIVGGPAPAPAPAVSPRRAPPPSAQPLPPCTATTAAPAGISAAAAGNTAASSAPAVKAVAWLAAAADTAARAAADAFAAVLGAATAAAAACRRRIRGD
jgi:hypothetical protein